MEADAMTGADYASMIQKYFPASSLLRAEPLAGGISAHTTALEFHEPHGQPRKVILRCPGETALGRNPGAARDEFRVLQLAHSLGLPVPAPLALDESGDILPTPGLLMEYIEGWFEFAPGDAVGCAGQMADALVRIHAVDAARPDLAFLPNLDEMAEINHTPAKGAALPVAAIHAALAGRPFPRANPPALLHGDFWPGNILWRDARLAAVIDWEDACRGDPLADLAIARLDLLWIYGPDAMRAFTARYLDRSPIDTLALPRWDLSAALRLARLAGPDLDDWAGFFHPYGRDDIRADTIRAAYEAFVNPALAAVSAA